MNCKALIGFQANAFTTGNTEEHRGSFCETLCPLWFNLLSATLIAYGSGIRQDRPQLC